MFALANEDFYFHLSFPRYRPQKPTFSVEKLLIKGRLLKLSDRFPPISPVAVLSINRNVRNSRRRFNQAEKKPINRVNYLFRVISEIFHFPRRPSAGKCQVEHISTLSLKKKRLFRLNFTAM